MGYLGDVNDLLSIKFCSSGQGDGVVSEAGFFFFLREELIYPCTANWHNWAYPGSDISRLKGCQAG